MESGDMVSIDRAAESNARKINGCAQVPPGAGNGKPWKFRLCEWYEINPKKHDETVHKMALIPSGMLVHESLHTAYREARYVSAKAVETYRRARVYPPYSYALMKRGDEVVGYGAFEADDDADDMAWLSCMFLEMGLKTAFPMPPDETAEASRQPDCTGAYEVRACS